MAASKRCSKRASRFIVASTSALRRARSTTPWRCAAIWALLFDEARLRSFAPKRQHRNDQRAGHGQPAEPGMEQEADQQIERRPRQIEERGRAGRGEELPDLVEVADRVDALAVGGDCAGRHGRAEGQAGQILVQPAADPGQHARAYRLENRLDAEQEGDDDQQRHQRLRCCGSAARGRRPGA